VVVIRRTGIFSWGDGDGHAIWVVNTGHEAVVEHQETGRGGRVVFGRIVVFRGWDDKRVVVEKVKAIVL